MSLILPCSYCAAVISVWTHFGIQSSCVAWEAAKYGQVDPGGPRSAAVPLLAKAPQLLLLRGSDVL